jgi:hypothetical protein
MAKSDAEPALGLGIWSAVVASIAHPVDGLYRLAAAHICPPTLLQRGLGDTLFT